MRGKRSVFGRDIYNNNKVKLKKIKYKQSKKNKKFVNKQPKKSKIVANFEHDFFISFR